jgi:hypothetical protein
MAKSKSSRLVVHVAVSKKPALVSLIACRGAADPVEPFIIAGRNTRDLLTR